jgi:hypothetical protein
MKEVKRKYKVLKFMTRVKEGMKIYKVGEPIMLNDFDCRLLLKHGFVEKIAKKKGTKKAK